MGFANFGSFPAEKATLGANRAVRLHCFTHTKLLIWDNLFDNSIDAEKDMRTRSKPRKICHERSKSIKPGFVSILFVGLRLKPKRVDGKQQHSPIYPQVCSTFPLRAYLFLTLLLATAVLVTSESIATMPTT